MLTFDAVEKKREFGERDWRREPLYAKLVDLQNRIPKIKTTHHNNTSQKQAHLKKKDVLPTL